jgi:GNAT superfamily N-acetyltransferase
LATTTHTPGVTIRELRAADPIEPFIDVEWTINRGDPNWIPPLRMTLGSALNRRKHPFHAHADVAYFLAEGPSGVVGRVAAIVNRLHNEHHGDRVGFFGLFQCVDDAAIAAALLDAAAGWLRDRGMDVMRGPLNFSTNEEVASPGVLVEGFDTPPMLMMTYNPPYFAGLLEASGLTKAKDLLATLLDQPDAVPARGANLIDRLLQRAGVTIRPLELKRFREDVDALKEVYNAAWSGNWGFVPMTDAEFEHLAREFRPVVDPDLCFIAEVGDEPVGFSLALPNLNEALRHLPDGRLLPFGWAKVLWYRRRIRSIRYLTVGLKPRLHHAGIGQAFYRKTWLAAVAKGYVRGEGSWILEDNYEMLRAIERMGGRAYKRYRIYERSI